MVCAVFVLLSSYDDQLLVQFNIDCGKDNLAFFDITSLNIQGAEDCEDRDGNKRYSLTIYFMYYCSTCFTASTHTLSSELLQYQKSGSLVSLLKESPK